MLPYVRVKAFDPAEESTAIEMACLLRSCLWKRWLIVPLLSLLTIFIFPIMLYWRPSMQAKWLYRIARELDEATHIYLHGKGK